jgi:site-specific DNA-methyltransferase (cytosine-N4-specific)
LSVVIHCGDALSVLRKLPSNSVDCCVTSPPYWALRDYGVEGQIGLEPTPEVWCAKLIAVFREVRRALKPTGTCWINVGDSYAGSGLSGGTNPAISGTLSYRGQRGSGRVEAPGLKPKDLVGQPWMLAFALRADGWYLRRDIIWHKPNAMPESTKDRPTTAHEYLFLLSKSEQYFYDATAIMEPTTGKAHSRGSGVNPKAVSNWSREPGAHNVIEFFKRPGRNSRIHRDRDPAHQTRAKIAAKQNRSFSAAVAGIVERRNARSVWSIPTSPYREAHFATFPARLAERCILAGSSAHGCCSWCGWPITSDGPDCTCSLAGDPTPALVLDPFAGAATTLMVAERLGRDAIGIELNAAYVAMAEARLARERERRAV